LLCALEDYLGQILPHLYLVPVLRLERIRPNIYRFRRHFVVLRIRPAQAAPPFRECTILLRLPSMAFDDAEINLLDRGFQNLDQFRVASIQVIPEAFRESVQATPRRLEFLAEL